MRSKPDVVTALHHNKGTGISVAAVLASFICRCAVLEVCQLLNLIQALDKRMSFDVKRTIWSQVSNKLP